MKQFIKYGTTAKKLVIFVQNSTTGVAMTGLTNASSGLTWYYYREDSTAATVVSVVGETLGTWTSGGFVEISSTHLPGFYEIGVPNAVLAATNSPAWVVMGVFGVASMTPVNVEIQLTAFDPTDGVSLGLTDVKANVLQWNSANVATPAVSGVPKVDVVDWLGVSVTANSGVPAVSVTSNLDKTGYSLSQAFPSNFSSLDIDVSGRVDVSKWLGTAVTSNAGVPIVTVSSGTITTVTGGVTIATNNDKTGYSLSQSFPSNFSALDIDLSGRVDVSKWLGTAVTSNVGVPNVNVLGGTVGAVSGTVGSVTGNIGGSVASVVGDIGGNLDGSILGAIASVTSVGTVTSVLNPVSISTGQLTVKKNTALNGFTFPMYDAATGTPSTGLSVSGQKSIDGASLTNSTNAVAEVGGGIYKLNLSAADLNGTVITLIFTATGASATIVTLITQV